MPPDTCFQNNDSSVPENLIETGCRIKFEQYWLTLLRAFNIVAWILIALEVRVVSLSWKIQTNLNKIGEHFLFSNLIFIQFVCWKPKLYGANADWLVYPIMTPIYEMKLAEKPPPRVRIFQKWTLYGIYNIWMNIYKNWLHSNCIRGGFRRIEVHSKMKLYMGHMVNFRPILKKFSSVVSSLWNYLWVTKFDYNSISSIRV